VVRKIAPYSAWAIARKYEARNPKFETIPNVQNPNLQNNNARTKQITVLNLGHLDLEFVSDFDIRISGLVELTRLSIQQYVVKQSWASN